ncbi:MAG: hypothetical protein ACR2FN_02960 [Chitinophagaceae bacterium]
MEDDIVIIYSDAVISKMKPKQPYVISKLIVVEHDKYNEEIIEKLNHFTTTNRSGEIRDFLLKEDYITPVEYKTPSDKLTKKGEKAKELGGHNAYKIWEAKKKRMDRVKNFIVYIFVPLVTLLTLILQ